MKFLINIRKKRFEKNISQEMMALELGISQSTYAKIENGKQKLPTRMLIRIATLLETSIVHYSTKNQKTKVNSSFYNVFLVLITQLSY